MGASLELTAAHIAGLARMAHGAYGVSFDNHGSITIQGDAEDVRDVPESLGLTCSPKMSHTTGTTHFRIFDGLTHSAFGTFHTRVVLCEPVEIPSDCYVAEFS